MTRDHAKRMFAATRFHSIGAREPDDWLDMFLALGLIHFDEGGSAIQARSTKINKIRSFMQDCGLGHMSPNDLDSALIRAGLDIVDTSAFPRPQQNTPHQPEK